jgi:hypothetical protein
VSPFAWDDYLTLAKRLALPARGDATEAELRSAISRAYYAAYHAASSYVRAQALVSPAERLTHTKVWDVLARDPATERAEVGQRGDVLRRVRVSADYRNPFPDTDIVARVAAALVEADRLVVTFSELQVD